MNIQCGDVFDMLPSLKESSIDLIISSPPYGIGKNYEIAKTEIECRKWAIILVELLSPLVEIMELYVGKLEIG